MKPHKFKTTDRIMRITDYHYAGDTDHDYANAECQLGSVGTVSHYYPPNGYDESKASRDGLVVSVEWDTGRTSAINEECLDFEHPPVTPDEEAAIIASILRGANHG